MIIMYHRVRDQAEGFLGGVSPREFERQIAYLNKNYRFLSMSELHRHIRQRDPVPENSVVLTFDDGFRDNYENAFPILRRYEAPAIIYLVSDSIETGRLPWPQRVGFILESTNVRHLELGAVVQMSLPVVTAQQRKRAFHQLLEIRKQLTVPQLELVASEMADVLDVDPPRDRMLTWDQVREMGQHRIEFGGHTVNHPLLARVPFAEAQSQMAESRLMIANRLGTSVPHFCFPGGSVNDRLVDFAKHIGFQTCFRPTRLDPMQRLNWRARNVNTHASDPHALRRIGAYDQLEVLAAELAGGMELLRTVRTGLLAATRKPQLVPQAEMRCVVAAARVDDE